MRLQLKPCEQELFDLLFQIPPRYEEARSFLQRAQMTSDDVTRVAITYAERCFLDFGDQMYDDEQTPLGRLEVLAEIVPELHSAYLYDVIALLLMEHGADPNILVGGETVFEMADFAVWLDAAEQEIRWRYDAWVHIWFVLLAYGGGAEEIRKTIEVFREYGKDEIFDLKKLRNQRNYGFRLSRENREPIIHIFDKNTLWLVAKG